MNLEQLVAEVLHELPFVFAVISLTIYSSFVFWFERWRTTTLPHSLCAMQFVSLLPHSHLLFLLPLMFWVTPLMVLTKRVIPLTLKPLQVFIRWWITIGERLLRITNSTRVGHFRADQLSGNMGHIRRPLPFNMQEQLSFINHDRFYGYIDSHIPVPDPRWALPYQFHVLFRHWQSVIIESLPYDGDIH